MSRERDEQWFSCFAFGVKIVLEAIVLGRELPESGGNCLAMFLGFEKFVCFLNGEIFS